MAHTAAARKSIEHLIDALRVGGPTLNQKKVTAGFDGFVDTIVRIIKTTKENGDTTLFKTKKEFGKYILEKGETSFSLELEERSRRIGGNMPIMSNALAYLGAKVNCIGTLGRPQTHPVFKNLHGSCQLFSFAEPGYSTAYEFNDGKILLAQMGELNHLKWEQVKHVLGLEAIRSFYWESDLISLVNWSEIAMSTDIWKGVLKEIISKNAKPERRQLAFFDLADCSKRTAESIDEVLQLLTEYAKHTRVMLGLNKNETHGIYKVLFNKKPKKELKENGERIFEKLGLDLLLLHSSKEAMALEKNQSYSFDSFFVKHPVISTGAGDNFNAGFCAGQLLELGAGSSLILAHAVSGLFVQTGKSPGLSEVSGFLQEYINKNK